MSQNQKLTIDLILMAASNGKAVPQSSYLNLIGLCGSHSRRVTTREGAREGGRAIARFQNRPTQAEELFS